MHAGMSSFFGYFVVLFQLSKLCSAEWDEKGIVNDA